MGTKKIDASHFSPDTLDFLRILDKHAVTYLIVGGEAPGADGAESLQSPNLVIQYGVPPNRIDLLGGIAGVGFEEAWTGRHTAVVVPGGEHDDVPVHFIGFSELLKNKRAAGRPKDLMDVEYLSGTACE